jgi:hypothetical protein
VDRQSAQQYLSRRTRAKSVRSRTVRLGLRGVQMGRVLAPARLAFTPKADMNSQQLNVC